MSDFSVSLEQRRRLLQGDYRPLTMPVKPTELVPGARYVLAYRQAQAVRTERTDNPEMLAIPKHPVWWITVTKVEDDPVRRPEARWLVRFDVSDERDRDTFLAPGGGYTSSFDVLDAGPVPDGGWLDVHHREVREFWQEQRVRRNGEKLQRQNRSRRQRAA